MKFIPSAFLIFYKITGILVNINLIQYHGMAEMKFFKYGEALKSLLIKKGNDL